MVTLNLTVPVYNGVSVLANSIARLHNFAKASLPFSWQIVIANNGSTDGTLHTAQRLAATLENTRVLHLDAKGRGRALKTAWRRFPADVLAYMDVDLSTDLAALPELVSAIRGGSYDLATGSRLLRGSKTVRCLKREVVSRWYNLLVKLAFGTRFSDAQCGFKAIVRAAAGELLPLVQDNGWFFDTELLVLAEKLGYRILDIPVHWTENSDTRVRIWRTAFEDVGGLLRLRRALPHIREARLRPHKLAAA